jgi:hypothetical protein
VHNILITKLEWKRPLGRSKHSWEGNIKKYRKEFVCEFVDWIHLVQDLVAGSLEQ